jgi:hypothetical protein
MLSNNAADYLVRSTSWVSNITGNQTAMTDIGASDYCANKLLANSTWRTAICDSAYFEKVLNVKVPTMTSNTTPSGTAFANYTASGSYAPYYVFDGNASTEWYANSSSGTADNSIGYMFTKNINVGKCKTDFRGMSGAAHSWNIKVQGSTDGITYNDISDSISTGSITNSQTETKTLNCTNTNKYKYFRLYFGRGSGPNNGSPIVSNVQFYGH